MKTNRLEAFSDGVLAIILTIMVLEMKAPQGEDLLILQHHVLPKFLCYVLSFIYVGIYWNNHHHMMHLVNRVTGSVLWANLHLLFWLSLIPFATAWMGENHFSSLPTALYGVVLLMCAAAYWVLQKTAIASEGANSALALAVGKDYKGKLSTLLYVFAIASAFIIPWFAKIIFILVALIWFIPDKRIERVLPR